MVSVVGIILYVFTFPFGFCMSCLGWYIVLNTVWFGAPHPTPPKCLVFWLIQVVAEKLVNCAEKYQKMCGKLLAVQGAQMWHEFSLCYFRSRDCFYCGTIKKTSTEFRALTWCLFWSQWHSAALAFTGADAWLLWRNDWGKWCLRWSCNGYYTRVAVIAYRQSGSRLLRCS